MDNHQYYISKIKDALKDSPTGSTVSELGARLSMSRNTVSKYLELMLVSGSVETRSIGKSKLYFLSGRIQISTILNYLSDAIVETDRWYRIKSANPAALDLLASGQEGLYNRNLLDILSMNGMKNEIKAKIIAPDRPQASTIEIELGSGDTVSSMWMTFASLVMNNGDHGMIFVFEDVTAWKKAEELRNYYEQISNCLYENADSKIYLMTTKEELTKVNDQFSRVFSKKPEEMKGLFRKSLYPQKTAELLTEAATFAINSQKPHRTMVEVEENGENKWYDDRYYPIKDCSGKITGIFTISRDITGFNDHSSAKVLMETLLPMLSDTVITTTPTGSVLSWNEGAEKMTGYPAEELIGSSVFSIIPPDINEDYDIIEKTLSEDGIKNLKGLIRAKGGRKKRVTISSSCIYDNTGLLTGICIVCHDQ